MDVELALSSYISHESNFAFLLVFHGDKLHHNKKWKCKSLKYEITAKNEIYTNSNYNVSRKQIFETPKSFKFILIDIENGKCPVYYCL